MAEFDSVIPAGGSGKIIGKVRTGGTEVGRRTKSIRVQTNDPNNGLLYLRISYEVVPVIQVLPSSRPRVDVVEGQSATHSLLLRRGDGKPLELRNVQSVLPEVVMATPRAAKAGERGGEDLVATAGDVWLDVQVTAPADGRARSVRLAAATNHPQMARLVLPVVVLVQKLVETRPEQVRLWLGTGDRRYESIELELRHSAGEPFSITGVESSHPELFSVVPVSAEPGPLQRVRVELVEPEEELAGASLRGELRVATTLESLSEVSVPVLVGERRRPARSDGTPAQQDVVSSERTEVEPRLAPSEERPAGDRTLRQVPTVPQQKPTPKPVEVGYGGSTR